MRGFYTVVVALMTAILLAGLAQGWSFSNVASSIGKLMQPESGAAAQQVVSLDGSNAAPSNITPEVLVQGRIIVVPLRKTNNCEPGQQLDRRGKCRPVW